ncbi:DUF2393 family protein [Campylobacter sp. RM16190]|uniref:DUF2393 family protein n=1 Tax=Campylobacter sp. RM16190 TaxID=1705727 RepID=UPI0014735C90|nr:DUF2393 family protein [Campylobacter sp. RM16190]
MLNKLKEGLSFYLEHLSWIDIAAYIWLILMFFILFVACIYLITRFHVLGFLLMLLNLVAFSFGLFYINRFLDENLRTRNLELISQKQLSYSNTLLVDLKLTNLSKNPFKYCRIDLKFYKPSGNELRNQINMLRPIMKDKIFLKEIVDINETRRVQGVINNFRLSDYNITVSSECF